MDVPRLGGPGDIDPLVIVLLMVWALVTIKIEYSSAYLCVVTLRLKKRLRKSNLRLRVV